MSTSLAMLMPSALLQQPQYYITQRRQRIVLGVPTTRRCHRPMLMNAVAVAAKVVNEAVFLVR